MADNSERGSTLVTVAILLVVLFSFMALAVDVGVGYVERRRIQGVADAASLAGAQMLTDNYPDAAIWNAIVQYAQFLNPPAVGETRAVTATWMSGTTNLGINVNGGGRPTGVTGILVTVRGTTPTFFANVLGITQVTAAAQGGGGWSPLDLVLVLDQSTSMLYDSVCDFASYFNYGRPCDGINGGDPLGGAYCDDCRGVWRRPWPWSPYACYWPDNSLMGSVPAKCAALGVTTQAGCEACKGDAHPFQPITAAQAAAVYFVGLVDAELAPTFPRLGLVTYSTHACLPTSNPNHPCRDLTYSLPTVSADIASILMVPADPMYFTNCEEGLSTARGYLNSTGRATAVKTIVFLTDGQANRCIGVYNSTCTQARARAIHQAELAATAPENTKIFTIGLGVDADVGMLKDIAKKSGASGPNDDDGYVFVTDATKLAEAYARLFAKIKQLRLVQ